ncbi:MAG: TRAP transporter substrate-binding protein [Anaerotruncus sp.]|nr:TRAP transporter substrate-binding protein [Anaerotruncus sp.]
MKSKKSLAIVTLALVCSLALSACGGNGAPANASSATGTAVTADGKDADGNVVDTTAYSISLGAQWFTEEDLEIWEHIEDPSSNPDKIQIRYGNTSRSDDESAYGRCAKRFLIDIKKNLGDRVEIKKYYNGTLGTTADQILGGLQAGNFEVMTYNVGAWYEYTKAFTPFDMGFLIPDLAAGIALSEYDNPVAQAMKQKAIDDIGVYPIMMPPIGMRHITNNIRPINSLDDIKGLKLRVQSNNMHMSMFEALGASPTPIAFAELFTAMQQKTVDGQENPVQNIFEQNYAEVQKYMTLSNHLYTAGATAINYSWLKGLPEDVQEVIENAARAAQTQSGKDLLNCEADMMDYLKIHMEVNELSDEDLAKFREMAKTTWDMGKEVMGDEYYNKIIPLIESELAKLG